MSNVIASQRSFAPFTPGWQQPSRIIPNTDYLDVSYDKVRRALWIYLTDRAPAYVSLELIQDLLGVDNVFSTSLASNPEQYPPVDFKIMASKRRGVFSLGGDLASFRYHIDQRDRNALTQYAHAALDAIWTNTQAASVEGMTTVSLVQGEAQGGGFEAALSSHVLVAEKGAMFGFPEALFGMFPGMGGYALLSSRTNSDCAKRLIGSTNRYPAEMLHEMGVVDVLADKGKGPQTINEWMRDASRASTLEYRQRFADLDRNQLLDSVEEWVEQALSLNHRQLRTMGYILEAQKRASQEPPKATITPIRRMIGFEDLRIESLATETANGTPSPLLIAPKSSKRFNEGEFLSFIKKSRPWVYENLSRHGAVILRGFPCGAAESMNRISAALRPDRSFNLARSIPTPAALYENVFEDDCWHSEIRQGLHNAYSDCAIFPAFKILQCGEHVDGGGPVITIANTRSIYQHLDEKLVLEFERRGLTYRRLFPNGQERGNDSANAHSWQHVFKTSQRDDVEKKCRENGLSYRWNSDKSLEVWNSAPACISHPHTGDRLWFNQVHLFSSSAGFVQRRSLLSKLFSIVRSPSSTGVSFSDGTAIPEGHIVMIAAAHQNASFDFELQGGDFLLLDNALTAQGRYAMHADQRLLVTMY